ncbi:MAG: endonuclease [Leptolyngbyaceae cyanobacterium SL_5_14]|nr:endonuclease [Leptolyngbyaceae cyanobacterium SL_5_14]
MTTERIVINEIRIDQPGTDESEFFELGGTPGTSLDNLTYIVIGDSDEGSSGVIEAVVELDGQAIQADGLFAAGEDTNSFVATLDLIGPSGSPGGLLNFENSNNVTHLLVNNFTGTDGQDLDTNDDGVLDITPWETIVDSVALIETIGSGNLVYSDTQVGPDGNFVPGLVFRDPDTTGELAIGQFTFGIDDTPGVPAEPVLDDPVAASIPQIQGAGHVSPLISQTVRTTGVITAISNSGFYVQDVTGDGNDATSDAIFVESADAASFAIGNEVEIVGVVEEAVSGGLGFTQIAAPQITILNETVNLPAPVVLGEGGRTVPNEFVVSPDEFGVDLSEGIPTSEEFVEAGGPINLNLPEVGNANFDPEQDGIDFYESLEGMLVTLNDTLVVQSSAPAGGPGFTFTDDSAVVVVDGGASSNSLNDRNGVTIGVGATDIFTADVNPERIEVDFANALTDLGEDFNTVIPQGSSLGNVTGILSYAGTVYELLPTQPITVTPEELDAEVTNLRRSDDRLLIAAYNVLNLDPNEGADVGGDSDIADGRFDTIAQQIINNLNAPDIVALQEIQDNDGAADEGGDTDVSAADETLQQLVDTIAANGGPTYAFLDNPFIADDANGGEPGGNIRTAFLYNPDRVDLVEDSLRPISDPATQQDDISGNNVFESSRLPLVADFVFNGETVTVVSVHNTAGGIENFGNIQPVVRSGSDARSEQAAEINAFVDGILAENSDAKVVVAGDWNGFDYEEWDAFAEGTADGGEQVLFNLTDMLPQLERYTFQFSNGNLTPLDHIFVTENLVADAEFDAVHVNAEFPDLPARGSDHDPILVAIAIDDANSVEEGDRIVGSAENDTLTGGNGDDIIFGILGNDSLSGKNGNDRIFGGTGNDTISGGNGNDRNFGGIGSDILNAGVGNDTLLGQEGEDILNADNGDDLLWGGSDDDLLSGGQGRDTFVLAVGQGTDTVSDFDISNDFIGLANGLALGQISLEGNTIRFGDETLAILSGIDTTTLTANSFVAV